MLIFFDTEFTDVGVDTRLISIGCVSESNADRTFYAELSDTYQRAQCSAFTLQEVLPKLEGGKARMPIRATAHALKTWIEAFGIPVQLATDSISFDWPWIQKLFHELGAWPSNLAARPVGIPTDYPIFLQAKFVQTVEAAFAGALRRHHSLDDARANRLGFKAMLPDASAQP
jgi:hypothetical protein